MLLSALYLVDVGSVNIFNYANEASFSAGDTTTVYFQLIDASVNKAADGWVPSGRRYMPAAGSTLSVTLVNIDDAKQITRFATQPFAQDSSIWALSILASDNIGAGTIEVHLSLSQAGVVTNGAVCSPIRVY